MNASERGNIIQVEGGRILNAPRNRAQKYSIVKRMIKE
jgi:RNase P/RNase MRP subunit p29